MAKGVEVKVRPRAPMLPTNLNFIDPSDEQVKSLTAQQLAEVATSGLAACCETVSCKEKEVLDVVAVGSQPSMWTRAHDAFDEVRIRTLEVERDLLVPSRSDPSPEYLLLFVAENAARLLYNATNPVDPFDADSASSFFRSLSRFVVSLPSAKQEQLAQALREVLIQVNETVAGPE